MIHASLRRSLRLLPVGFVAVGAALAASAVPVPTITGPEVFEFRSLNKRYDRLAPEMVPIQYGESLTIQLSSPQHQLDLVRNRIVLKPRGEGLFDAGLELEFSGNGRLIADLDLSGTVSRLEDKLTVPSQRQAIYARVRIFRSPSGYLVTPLELPSTFPVRIESQLGERLVATCRGVGFLLGLDCASLDQAVSEVRIPMPSAGETYLVESARLSAEERARLDAYLEANGVRRLDPAKPAR